MSATTKLRQEKSSMPSLQMESKTSTPRGTRAVEQAMGKRVTLPEQMTGKVPDGPRYKKAK